jgi:hypothetical protein
VTAGKLGIDSVTSAAILDGTILSGDIAAKAVTTGKINDGAVDTAQLAPGAVDSGRIAPGAVTNSKIGLLAVDTAQLAVGAVGTTQIAPGAITSSRIAANSVDGSQIINASVAAADLAPNSVDGTKVQDGSLSAADIAASGTNGPLIGAFNYDPPPMPGNTCTIVENSTSAVLGVRPGDHVILNLDEGLEPELDASPLLAINPNLLRFRLCNRSDGVVDGASRLYAYVVIR